MFIAVTFPLSLLQNAPLMKQNEQPPPCPEYNGTGQITWFGGVSHFQFSHEGCPECNGFGFLIPAEENPIVTAEQTTRTGLSPEKAKQFLNVLAQTLSNALVRGENIQLTRQFGKLFHFAG